MKKLLNLPNMIALGIILCSLVLTFLSAAYLQRGSSAPGGEILIPVIGGLLAAWVLTAAKERKAKQKHCRVVRVSKKKYDAQRYHSVA